MILETCSNRIYIQRDSVNLMLCQSFVFYLSLCLTYTSSVCVTLCLFTVWVQYAVWHVKLHLSLLRSDFPICAVNSTAHINSYDNLLLFLYAPASAGIQCENLHFMKNLGGLWAVSWSRNALNFIECKAIERNEIGIVEWMLSIRFDVATLQIFR